MVPSVLWYMAMPILFQVVGLVTAMAGPTGYAANPARDLGPRLAHFVLPIPNKVSRMDG